MPEEGRTQGPERTVTDRLSAAVDELRQAAESASGEVRSRIDTAVEQIREASGAAATRAQESAGELRGQLDSFRNWIQNATVDLLDEVQREIDKRRQQLMGGRGGDGGGAS